MGATCKTIPTVTIEPPQTSEGGNKDVEDEINDFVNEALDAHNELRAKHGVPPLTVNKDLCQIAQQWSDKLAAEDKFEHSSPQTLLIQGDEHSVGKEATQMWYDEIKDYDFKEPGFSMNTGHFTQVVWKDSQFLGIAKATGPKGNVIVTANYCPSGNFMDNFQENVLPLIYVK